MSNPTEGQDKIDTILNDVIFICGGSTHEGCDNACEINGYYNSAKQALKTLIAKEIDVIIGDPLSEADGWEWNFSEEAKCCPGDDFAFYGNNIKDTIRQRAKERGWL